MRQRLVSVISACAGIALVCPHALAQPLIDNLGEKTRAATVLGTVKPDVLWATQSFSSPTRYTLVSIQTILGNAVDGPDAIAELRSGDAPTGPALVSFAIPALAEASLEIVTLAPNAPITIEPDTLYWLVLGPATIGSFEWAYANGNNYAGTGALGSYGYSNDFGVTWPAFGNKNPYQVRINVSPITCDADFNSDGVANSQDFFDFLTAFFALDPSADFNHDAFINSQDFFDFLAAFFAGC